LELFLSKKGERTKWKNTIKRESEKYMGKIVEEATKRLLARQEKDI
jgi:hypothetical protein